jgi:hypothetical protein
MAAAQAHHVGGRVAALDELPAGVAGPVFFQGFDLLLAAQLSIQGFGHGNYSERLRKASGQRATCTASDI